MPKGSSSQKPLSRFREEWVDPEINSIHAPVPGNIISNTWHYFALSSVNFLFILPIYLMYHITNLLGHWLIELFLIFLQPAILKELPSFLNQNPPGLLLVSSLMFSAQPPMRHLVPLFLLFYRIPRLRLKFFGHLNLFMTTGHWTQPQTMEKFSNECFQTAK